MAVVLHKRVGRSSLLKFHLVLESYYLSGTGFGRLLRAHGLREIEIITWRRQMESGLENHTKVNVDTKNDYKKKIAKLEKELRGAQAIIEAQKKVSEYLEEKAASTPKKTGKKSAAKS